MSAAVPSISTRSLSSLLEALKPGTLAKLREAFPEHSEIFETSYVLGAESTADLNLDAGRHAALRALVEETLAAAKPSIPLIVRKITKRMRRARNARLAGGAAAACAAALLAAHAAGTIPGNLQLIAAAVSLAASLLVLVGEHLDKPVIGGQRGLGELLADTLLAEEALAEVHLRMLAPESTIPVQLFEIARRANEAAARVRQVWVFGGLSLPSDPAASV